MSGGEFDPASSEGFDPEGSSIGPEEFHRLADQVPGARGKSPLHMPARAWAAIAKRIWVMTGFHHLSLLAAGVAFYAFLAFVPLIAATVLIYGLIGDPQTVTTSIDMLRGFAPREVLTILDREMLSIVTASAAAKGLGLVVSLFFSLFGAMRAANAMIAALNIIYEEVETRNILRLTALSAAITLGMVTIGIIGVGAISLFTYVQNFLAPYVGDRVAVFIQILDWLFAGLMVSITFAIFFRFAPDRRSAKWRWLSAGSVVSTLLWIAITLGFGFYVANVTNYDATYGSLAAIVIFLMWLFLSAYAVMLGAEVNAETERQTFVDSTVGPDRPLGQRGAVMADTVVLNAASRAMLEKKRRRQADRLADRAS